MRHNKLQKGKTHPKLLFFTILMAATLFWMKSVVGTVTFDEIVFHLSMPLRGTDTTLFVSFFRNALLPTIAIDAAVTLLARNWSKIQSRLRRQEKPREDSNNKLRAFAVTVKMKRGGYWLFC